MPISRLQSDILRLIATNRDPESFVAGSVPINRSGPRYSADIDVFHDRQERVAEAALADAALLADVGYEVPWIRQQPATNSAVIRHGADETKLEWVADSDYRFFTAVKDDQFGYVLHVVDLAINKVMAAASRREPRDVVDLLTLHDRVLPLGALVWAAVERAPATHPKASSQKSGATHATPQQSCNSWPPPRRLIPPLSWRDCARPSTTQSAPIQHHTGHDLSW